MDHADMEKMDNKIAVMIDSDNTQLSKLESVLQEVSTHGRIVVKRAYGNWQKENLKHWESELKRLAIKAEQQFDYTVGKNATDMALVIDTITLLHRNIYDAFVIVSSDSDFTPLAIYLRESGVYVMGVGEKKTPIAFRNSCDEFIFLENLDMEPAQQAAQKSMSEDVAEKRGAAASGAEKDGSSGKQKTDSIQAIHRLLRIASDQFAETDGYTNLASAGSYIKRVKPDFDVRTYGFKKLVLMLEAFPKKYKLKKTKKLISYQCL